MQPIAVESETLERFRHLLFMLPPLLLYALAVVLFENKRAQALVREIGQATTPEEAERWLAERGLSFKFSNQLTQYLSIIAPFLAAPLSATMSFI